jgi:hypothetical protein
MLQFSELLSGNSLDSIPQEHQDNLHVLLDKVNQIRLAWNKPMTVSSGYRTMKHHLEIYAKKGIYPPHVPMKSAHLSGEACDIFDPNKDLQAWCKANVTLLHSIGIWMEMFSATPNWCHFQVRPYGSYVEGGSLWFNP